LQFAEVALESFLAFPVARVAPVVARRIVLLVAQMIGQLGLQGSFQDSFGQLFEQTVLPDDILGFLVLGEQLVDQLLVDGHGISFSSSPGRLHSSIYTLASAAQGVSEVRSSLPRQLLSKKLFLLGPVSRDGLCPIDLSREPARHRSLPSLSAE